MSDTLIDKSTFPSGKQNDGLGSELSMDEETPIEKPSFNENEQGRLCSWNNGKAFIEISATDNLKSFFKGCKWSPDGSCLLTNNGDNIIRIYDLPQILYTQGNWSEELKNKILPLVESVSTRNGGLVYDFAWFPGMSSWDPPSCCFLCTGSSMPIHLRDAFTGQLRASYLGYNKMDDVEGAYSVTFDSQGAHIFGGFKNEIKIFDLHCPGRKCTSLDLKKIADQRGIISCIAVNPDLSSILAAGSYNKKIGLYSDGGDLISLLYGHKGGLTHLMFSKDGMKLFSGARMDDEILCWDLRQTNKALFVLKRTVRTNQRIYFDISPDSKFLTTGSTDGVLRSWDLTAGNTGVSNSELTFEPCLSFHFQNDCVNGISYNPKHPVVATSSGQLHYPDISSDEESDFFFMPNSILPKKSCKIKLWWTGPC